MANAPAVVVEVRGGTVVGVYGKGLPEDTDLCIIDWDGAMEDPAPAEPDACYGSYFDKVMPEDTKRAFEDCMARSW
jgi:hypothetical protein